MLAQTQDSASFAMTVGKHFFECGDVDEMLNKCESGLGGDGGKLTVV